MPIPGPMPVDVVVFGGGVAGLWLLDELHRAGHVALLLEANALGTGQTICSQGIIHGGLKYSLDGLRPGSASAIAAMPSLWQECLAGTRQPDLGQTRVRASFCHVWRTERLSSRIGMMGARVGLRVKSETLAPGDRPAILAGCPGVVARLAEPVIDPGSLLENLAANHHGRILKIDFETGIEIAAAAPGFDVNIALTDTTTGHRLEIRPRQVVLTAGAGNAKLRRSLGLPGEAMQRRPLHMVMVRGGLPELNGHCVDGRRTRVTITSSSDRNGRTVWQVGGQIAEAGVEMDDHALITHASQELPAVIPGLDLADAEWATYRVDRAEPVTGSGARPDDAFARREGDTITAWPTKLALAPRLAERVMELMDSPAVRDYPDEITTGWPRPEFAMPPWETERQWISAP